MVLFFNALTVKSGNRYRNYRTFASPRPVQFSCIAIDSANEFVAAGAQDVFEIYLWSMKIGHLLEVYFFRNRWNYTYSYLHFIEIFSLQCLSGHEGPVVSIAFTPIASSSSFASTSWDKTLRIWNSLETAQEHDNIQLIAEGTCQIRRKNCRGIWILIFYHRRSLRRLSPWWKRNRCGVFRRAN